MSDDARLSMLRVSKSFGATKALVDVTLTVAKRQVHGLLGENGAGKSTLMKILAGVEPPDQGSITVDGIPLTLGRPDEAAAAGIAMAYQELSSPPNVEVATKLGWPSLVKGKWGLVSRARVREHARGLLTEFSAPEIDESATVSDLDLAQRQKLEIISALARRPSLLILDEPTGALSDTEWLFGIIDRVVREGSSVVYISHKLAEVREVCNTCTVLRNGSVAGTFDPARASEDSVIELMANRKVSQIYPEKASGSMSSRGTSPILEVENVSIHGSLKSVSLRAHPGEVVGIAGLEGQGQRELLYAIAGVQAIDTGTVRISNTDRRDGRSVALVPEERKLESLFLRMSSMSNLTISQLGHASSLGILSRKRESSLAARIAERVNLPRAMLSVLASGLSGGNQQKLAIGRAISVDPSCLVLFDPTRGVDIGTKIDLYNVLREFASSGRTVLLYSTELPELIGLADRIYVLSSGQIIDEVSGPEMATDRILGSFLKGGGPSVEDKCGHS